ncbi:MAG: tetratricopeptide repeat protein [Myxococcaceae bacterium]
MYNLLISVVVGVGVALGVWALGFGWLPALVPGVLAFLGAFVWLARRISLRVQGLMTQAQKELQAVSQNPREQKQRLERAVKILEEGLRYDRWQLLIGGEIHAQIGMLKYMGKDLDGAAAHLARSSGRNFLAQAIFGALKYQRKDYTGMDKAFESAIKNGRKEPLVWAAYAWCHDQLKNRDKALSILGRAVEANPSDEKLKSSLSALQNAKRLKMKPYEPQWWQFGLEQPPMEIQGGRRVQFQRR